MSDNLPKFGKTQGQPPSFFARVPSRAIWQANRPVRKKMGGLSMGDLHIFSALCAYANNQGFAYPNSKTIADQFGLDRKNVTRAFTKCERLGYIEKVSKFRSHPKWRHVMGTVWRIVYDDRLNQDELIDSMNMEDPPPVIEDDLPRAEVIDKKDAGNHEDQGDGIELVECVGVARWFAQKVSEITGEVRLVNPRSVEVVKALIDGGLTEDQIKDRALVALNKCREQRKPAPHHLGTWIID